MQKNYDSSAKKLKLEKGHLTVDGKILASIVALATKEIRGVSGLNHVWVNKVKSLANKHAVPGVSVKFAENGNLLVDVYITIFHGFNVPDVAFKVQENIKNNVSNMIGFPLKTINVHVTGVDFSPPAEN